MTARFWANSPGLPDADQAMSGDVTRYAECATSYVAGCYAADGSGGYREPISRTKTKLRLSIYVNLGGLNGEHNRRWPCSKWSSVIASKVLTHLRLELNSKHPCVVHSRVPLLYIPRREKVHGICWFLLDVVGWSWAPSACNSRILMKPIMLI